jgi:hypothetical protein
MLHDHVMNYEHQNCESLNSISSSIEKCDQKYCHSYICYMSPGSVELCEMVNVKQHFVKSFTVVEENIPPNIQLECMMRKCPIP